jgi:hypothetical protein
MAVVRAIEAFTYTDHKGVPQIIRVGDLLDESDPCVAKRRTLFESVGAAAARLSGVEAATAEPGEKRSRTRVQRAEKAEVDSGDDSAAADT